ncbi:MAG: heat-inducible transcription repressor HrcA [candidate division Zixibacteria bacterium]|nr:heat-inducible transcription repressor HrcA [candidate division Zixibacteria bacterium]
MEFENLSEREKQILKLLVDHYISTAEPVGSRTLSKQPGLGLSPATIRNILKDLEDMGYLTQPHTSAGRMPTNLGYRSYVDYLLKPENLSDAEKNLINEKIKGEYSAIDVILDQTSRILSSLSNQLGLTLAPKLESAILTKLELIPVAEKKLLVVLIVKSGLVRSIILEVDSNLPDMAINETVQILNERLCGLSLGEIKATIMERVKDTHYGDPRLIRMFVEGAAGIWDIPTTDDLHFAGTSNLLNQPEFQNPKDAAQMAALIEDKAMIKEMLDRSGITEGITITIGQSDISGKGEQLSLLASSYTMGGVKGVIGVIGPTRMNYSKLVSLVDYTARMLSKILTDKT